jgi:uncharacterized protein
MAPSTADAQGGDGTGANPRAADVGLAEKVEFLSHPAAYQDAGGKVETIETHMSWVFLAGESVFKLKKPVRFSYLDFSTLAAREANCRAELKLNRRLAPDVYLRVAPLTLTAEEGLKLDGAGQVVDWLVVMRRLPGDRMLDGLIARRALEPEAMDRLADVLARFYRLAERPLVAPGEYFRRIQAEQAENRDVLMRRNFKIDHGRAPAALKRMEDALIANRSVIEARAARGFLVDGHGDLRPEHVCFQNGIVIFDCLEFSPTLRQIDPVDEIAYLAMECARLGADWLGPLLMTRVAAALGWPEPGRLFSLHFARRALLRARLSLAHLLDPTPRQPERWEPLASRYIGLAEKALDRLDEG